MNKRTNMANIIRIPFIFFKNKDVVKNFVINYNLWLIILGMIIIATILSRGVFIMPANIFNLLLQSSTIGVIALGQFLVILTAGIDLSVGSILAASVMLCGLSLVSGFGILFSVLVSVALGSILGFANGIMVGKAKIPPFIATLGMLGIARSIAREINHGSPIWAIPENFLIFGRGYVGSIPVPVLIWGSVFFFTLFLVNRSRYGRYIYAVGANENAARLSGIKVDIIKLLVYTLAGMFCGIGAIIFVGRTQFANPATGMWYNLDSIGAVIIGGTSLFGGVGTVTGVFLGVLFVGILTNLMNILNINLFWQYIVKGIVLLAAVYINTRTKK